MAYQREENGIQQMERSKMWKCCHVFLKTWKKSNLFPVVQPAWMENPEKQSTMEIYHDLKLLNGILKWQQVSTSTITSEQGLQGWRMSGKPKRMSTVNLLVLLGSYSPMLTLQIVILAISKMRMSKELQAFILLSRSSLLTNWSSSKR